MLSAKSPGRVVAHASGTDVHERASAAVIGAYVADAASLGLHWVYNPKEIAAAVGDGNPEFHDVLSPFHAGKKAGDVSMYGEALAVTLRSIADKHVWSSADFIMKYYSSFGPGGSYVGYIDGATKGAIYNIMGLNKEVDAALKAPAGVTDGAVRMAVYKKLRGIAATHTGEALQTAAEQLAKEANPTVTAETLAYVKNAAVKLDELNARHVGTDDNQSNALAKLPAIVARFAGHRDLLHTVSESTRQTANSDEAITWCTFCARVLEAVIIGTKVKDAIAYNCGHLEQPYRAAVEHAVKLAEEEEDYVLAVGQLGQQCALGNVVPAVVYLALRHAGAPTYVQAIRENMLAGGDSNGRAVLLGALLAAANAGAGASKEAGVPEEWIARSCGGGAIAKLAHDVHLPVHGDAATDHIEVHKSAAALLSARS